MGLSQLVVIPAPGYVAGDLGVVHGGISAQPVKVEKYCTPVIASSRIRIMIKGVRDAEEGSFMNGGCLVVCVEECAG